MGEDRWAAGRKGAGYGQARVRDEQVPGRVRRPSGVCAKPILFRHFIEEARAQAGCVYGRQPYEVMRYWDEERLEWDAEEQVFAAAWRDQRKWVVSRSLKSVGPNATLVKDDLEEAIHELKTDATGRSRLLALCWRKTLTDLRSIDEFRIYLHPIVLGHGRPYFAGPHPPLRLVAQDQVDEDVIKLTYVPA